MSALLWLQLVLAVPAAGLWVWINFSGRYGRSLRYRLDAGEDRAAGNDGVSRRARPGAAGDADAGTSPAANGVPDNGSAGTSPAANGADALPRVAIISPGRNEAEHLPTTLVELCEQDYPSYVVVFVDDDSDDATPTITAELAARYPHLTVVRNDAPPPPGWVGKCWALHRGYEVLCAADGEASPGGGVDWICFTDADIHWDPRLLRLAMAYAADHDAELVSVAPLLHFGSPVEAIVQLQLVLALGLMLPFEKAMDPDSPWTLTGGAFILVKRSYYDAIGGHNAVKGEMVDDLKLGMAIKAAGARHAVAIGDGLLWCRMYDGWADMWEGLTKNVYAGLGNRWWAALGLALAVLVWNVLPPVLAITCLVWLIVAPGWLAAVSLVLWLAVWVLEARALNTTRKLMRLPGWYAWTMPLGSALYLAIMCGSVRRYHTGGSIWKGRRYVKIEMGKVKESD